MGLLHLQQNIDIPEITLAVHPLITSAVKKAADAGKKARVEDLEDSVSDSSFLNAIQKDVSRWVREIQKVCVLVVSVRTGSPYFYFNVCCIVKGFIVVRSDWPHLVPLALLPMNWSLACICYLHTIPTLLR